MQTSQRWWSEVRADESRFNEWLRKQYHGEITAYERIRDYVAKLDRESGWPEGSPLVRQGLAMIAEQENTHALWIAGLLAVRGIPVVPLSKEERYWSETLPEGLGSIAEAGAVAHHAEMMRLERIRVIAKDEDAPADVREVFQRILPEEEFHARFFLQISNQEAIEKARAAHLRGAEAIGFVTAAETL